MAVHVWTSGESITASKLNTLERKKAFIERTLDLTSLTWNEAVALVDEFGLGYYYYNSNGYFLQLNSSFFKAATATDLLVNDNAVPIPK